MLAAVSTGKAHMDEQREEESLCAILLADSAAVMEKESVNLWKDLERVHQEVIRQLTDAAAAILQERPDAGPVLEARLRRMAATCERKLQKVFARGKEKLALERAERDAAIRQFCAERGSSLSSPEGGD